MDVGNKEVDLRKKNLLPWQDILNSRQTAADIEQKLAKRSLSWKNQSYLPSLIKQMEAMPRNHKQSAT